MYFYLYPSVVVFFCSFVFFKQKTAYEMRISDWSSDVCSSDLGDGGALCNAGHHTPPGSPILVARRTRALAASVRLVQTRVVRMNPVRTPPPTRSGLVTNGMVPDSPTARESMAAVRVLYVFWPY